MFILALPPFTIETEDGVLFFAYPTSGEGKAFYLTKGELPKDLPYKCLFTYEGWQASEYGADVRGVIEGLEGELMNNEGLREYIKSQIKD